MLTGRNSKPDQPKSGPDQPIGLAGPQAQIGPRLGPNRPRRCVAPPKLPSMPSGNGNVSPGSPSPPCAACLSSAVEIRTAPPQPHPPATGLTAAGELYHHSARGQRATSPPPRRRRSSPPGTPSRTAATKTSRQDRAPPGRAPPGKGQDPAPPAPQGLCPAATAGDGGGREREGGGWRRRFRVLPRSPARGATRDHPS
jgi:hypothetical protein